MYNKQNLNLLIGLLFGLLTSINATSGASVYSSSPMICDLETALLNETWGAYFVIEDQRGAAFNGDVQVPFGSYSNLTFDFNTDGTISENGNNFGTLWSVDCVNNQVSFNGNVCDYDGTGFVVPMYTSPGVYLMPITPAKPGCTDPTAVNYDVHAVVNEACIFPINSADLSVLADEFWQINTSCVHEDTEAFPLTTKFDSMGSSSFLIRSATTRGRNSDIAVNGSAQGNNFQGGSTFSYLTASLGYTIFSGGSGTYSDLEVTFYYNQDLGIFESIDGCYTIERIVAGCTDPTALNYYSYATTDNGNCFYALEGDDLNKTYEQVSINESCLSSSFSNEKYFGSPLNAGQQEIGRILSFSESANGNIFYTDVEIVYEPSWYDANSNYVWGWGPSLQSSSNGGIVRFGNYDSGMTLVKDAAGNVVAFHNFWTLEFSESWLSETLATDFALAGYFFDDAFCVNSVWAETSLACSNPNACNYSETADLFLEGYCEYPEDGFDCAGNCIAPDMNGTVWSYYDWNGDSNSPLLGNLQTAEALRVDVAGAISGEGTTQNTFISQWQCGTFDLYNMTFANGGITFNYVFDGSDYFWAASYTDSNTGQTAYLALVQETALLGCTDAAACNYDAAANMDNGACVFAITENILTSSNWAAESGFTCGATENYLGGNVSTTGGNQSYLVFNVDYTGEMFNFNQGAPISITTFTWSLSGCEVVTSVDLEIGVDGFALNASGNLVTFFNDAAAIPSCYNIEWAPFQEMGCSDPNACNYVDPAPDYNAGCQYPQPFYDCDGNCLVADLSNTTWDLYNGSTFNLGSLVEASVLTLNTGGGVNNQSGTGFPVDSWTQNCGMIGFTSSDPSIFFQEVSLSQNGLIQLMYFDPNAGSFMQQVLVPSGSVIGCMEQNACNFDPNATINSFSSCTYPQAPGFDCDGVCQVSFDVSNTSWDLYSAINSDNTLEGMQVDQLLESVALNLESSSAVSGSYFAQNNTWTQNCGVIQIGDGVNEPTMLQVVNNGAALFMSQFDPNTNTQTFFLFQPVANAAACTDETACNYDASATESDNTLCTYPEAGQDCDGNCVIEGTYLYLDFYDCGQYSPFEVTEANSPGTIASFEFIIDGNGGVVINEYIGGQGFIQQTTTYTYDNCVLNIQGFGDFEPQLDGSFLATTDNPDICRSLIEGTIGCINPNACNYDPNAYSEAGYFMPGGICEGPAPGYDCDGVCYVDLDPVGTWDQYAVTSLSGGAEPNSIIVGMGDLMESSVLTLNGNGSLSSTIFGTATSWTQDCGLITFSDGQVLLVVNNDMGLLFQGLNEQDEFVEFLLVPGDNVITGCTDDTACNYDIDATETDNTLCTYPDQGFDCDGNLIVIMGCTYENADNYNAQANDDDGSCVFSPSPVLGCTDDTAANYHPAATQDDSSCLYGNIVSCPGDFNDDGAINSGDLLVFLGVFGTNCD